MPAPGEVPGLPAPPRVLALPAPPQDLPLPAPQPAVAAPLQQRVVPPMLTAGVPHVQGRAPSRVAVASTQNDSRQPNKTIAVEAEGGRGGVAATEDVGQGSAAPTVDAPSEGSVFLPTSKRRTGMTSTSAANLARANAKRAALRAAEIRTSRQSRDKTHDATNVEMSDAESMVRQSPATRAPESMARAEALRRVRDRPDSRLPTSRVTGHSTAMSQIKAQLRKKYKDGFNPSGSIHMNSID